MVLNWYRQAIYSYRGLFGWLSWQSYTSTVVFRPVLNMAIYALVGKFAINALAAQSYVVGMAAYQIPFILLGGITNCLARDRFFGTLPFLYASRGSRTVSYFCKGVFHYPNAILAVSIVLFAAWLFLGLDFSHLNWLSLVVSALIIAASGTAAGLFIGNFAIIINDWATAYGAFAGAMLALTGVVIPVSSLPGFVSIISQGLPLTHGLVAFRAAFAGESLATIGNNILLELLVGLCYAVVGVALFRFMEREAKRRGVLDSPGTS